MKKRRFLISLLVVVGFCICFFILTTDKISEEVAKGYISISVDEGTLTRESVTIIINDSYGTGYNVYGQDFEIEKKEGDSWTKLHQINKYAFDLKAYYVDSNGFLKMTKNWKDIYGPLDDGVYRLIISYFVQSDFHIKEIDIKYLSVEFKIM